MQVARRRVGATGATGATVSQLAIVVMPSTMMFGQRRCRYDASAGAGAILPTGAPRGSPQGFRDQMKIAPHPASWSRNCAGISADDA